MKIGLVYNARPTGYDRTDPALEKHIEGDEWKTIIAIAHAVESNGHTVEYFPVDDNIYERLRASKPNLNLIFNLAEGMSQGLDREAHIPMFCEVLGLPYTGPGPLSSALILNKSRAKEIWRASGVSTADSQIFTTPREILKKSLTFPLIVKPGSEGSGIGIKSNSIVKNNTELRKAVTRVIKEYHQAALVESYLPGREFTVAIIGNGNNLTVLPIVEINFAGLPKDAPAIDSYEAKFVYGATGVVPMHQTEFCPADISPDLQSQINHLAKDAYISIGCRDFGRVDLRLDNQRNIYVLEINHPPGLMSDPNESSFFTIAGRAAGLSFNQMIGRILDSAIHRLKLSNTGLDDHK